ncbi:MAG: CTP synthetase [Chloroflexi bacterium]|nr:CTP synthetase [Chloroflexota bacterium]|tara:strand:- start:885 stop:2495 length:1611 start_codon:yes stop_codon:yes gene_type:complete
MSKFIFVTGGVVSSLGKGIAVASIARILKNRGVSVSVLKLDPYLNVDPGTMSPYQHGEVFVTGDGSETDLDLGHYERFIGMSLTGSSNLTAGKIYSEVIAKERKGEFLGGTIQVVPHVTDAIKSHMFELSKKSEADVIVVEVGGTVGDIEGLPFLEAIRQMRNEVGSSNVFYVHLTYLPYVTTTNELKTKPTQHSVRELRSIGILPDAIICRSDHQVADSIKDKIKIHCDVPIKGIFTLQTVESVYEVPSILEEQGLGNLIFNHIDISSNNVDMSEWNKMVSVIKKPKPDIKIAIVGKYVDLTDSYISVKEALIHAGIHNNRNVNLIWVNSEDIENEGMDKYLSSVSGIVVPGGFGPRGVEGMINTVRYSIDNNIPYLGLCLGLQVMVISVARFILGKEMANSLEFSEDTPHPVISLMDHQRGLKNLGGTMRLGVYPCRIVENSISHRAYGTSDLIYERHRHRFEFNNDYRESLDNVGLKATGLSPDGNLVEIMELVSHPFMVGVQFHPEFLSRPDNPHPLFSEFINSSIKLSNLN